MKFSFPLSTPSPSPSPLSTSEEESSGGALPTGEWRHAILFLESGGALSRVAGNWPQHSGGGGSMHGRQRWRFHATTASFSLVAGRWRLSTNLYPATQRLDGDGVGGLNLARSTRW